MAKWYYLVAPYIEDLDTLVRLSCTSREIYENPRIQKLIEDWKIERFGEYNKKHWNCMSIYNFSNQIGRGRWICYSENCNKYPHRQMILFSTQARMVKHFCNYIETWKNDLFTRIISKKCCMQIYLDMIYINPRLGVERRYCGLTTDMIHKHMLVVSPGAKRIIDLIIN